MKVQKSFEELWRAYVNGPEDAHTEQLAACLRAAISFNETSQVFHASFNKGSTHGIRSPALKKMLGFASTKKETEIVLQLASRTRHGTTIFPARVKEAKAKLETFKASA